MNYAKEIGSKMNSNKLMGLTPVQIKWIALYVCIHAQDEETFTIGYNAGHELNKKNFKYIWNLVEKGQFELQKRYKQKRLKSGFKKWTPENREDTKYPDSVIVKVLYLMKEKKNSEEISKLFSGANYCNIRNTVINRVRSWERHNAYPENCSRDFVEEALKYK